MLVVANEVISARITIMCLWILLTIWIFFKPINLNLIVQRCGSPCDLVHQLLKFLFLFLREMLLNLVKLLIAYLIVEIYRREFLFQFQVFWFQSLILFWKFLYLCLVILNLQFVDHFLHLINTFLKVTQLIVFFLASETTNLLTWFFPCWFLLKVLIIQKK